MAYTAKSERSRPAERVESEHLDTDDLLVVGVAQNHARDDLDRLDDVRAVEAQVQGIGMLVHAWSHGPVTAMWGCQAVACLRLLRASSLRSSHLGNHDSGSIPRCTTMLGCLASSSSMSGEFSGTPAFVMDSP